MASSWTGNTSVSLTGAAMTALAYNGSGSSSTIGTTTTATTTATPEQDDDTAGLGRRSLAEIVVWSILLSVILVTAVLGNLLVIACVRTTARLREEKSNMFLVNLSITDVGSACVVMTSSLHGMIADRWHLGSVWCDLVCGANYAFIIVSMLTLCFISLDRYAAVVYALRYPTWITRRRIRMLLAWAWFQGFCFGLAPVLAKWVRYDYWEVVCAIVWHEDTSNTLAYVIVAFAVCFLTPGVVLAVAYCKIIKVAKAQNNVHPHTAGPRPAPYANQPDLQPTARVTSPRPVITPVVGDSPSFPEAGGGLATPTELGKDQSSAEKTHVVNTIMDRGAELNRLHRQCSSPDLGRCPAPQTGRRDRQRGPGCHGLTPGANGLYKSDPNLHKESIESSGSQLVQTRTYTADWLPETTRLWHVKAGYPRKLVYRPSRDGVERSTWVTSSSAPVSPQCEQQATNEETGWVHWGKAGLRWSAPISARHYSDSHNSPFAGSPPCVKGWVPFRQDDARRNEPQQQHGPGSSDLELISQTAAAGQPIEPHTKSSRAKAWVEDQNRCISTRPSDFDNLVRVASPPSPAVIPKSSNNSGVPSCQLTSDPPALRPISSSPCQFTEIPRSPEPEPVATVEAPPNDRGHHRAKITADKHRNYSASSKAVKSLLIVVMAFFICMAPFSITKLYKVIFPRPDSLPGYVNLVATIFQYCSSVINPLIYGIFRKDFQKAFLLIFKRTLVRLRLRDSIDQNTEIIWGSA